MKTYEEKRFSKKPLMNAFLSLLSRIDSNVNKNYVSWGMGDDILFNNGYCVTVTLTHYRVPSLEIMQIIYLADLELLELIKKFQDEFGFKFDNLPLLEGLYNHVTIRREDMFNYIKMIEAIKNSKDFEIYLIKIDAEKYNL